jgi:hypothetical protein
MHAGEYPSGNITVVIEEDEKTALLEFDPPLPDQDCSMLVVTSDSFEETVFIRTLAGDINRDGMVTTTDSAVIKPHIPAVVDETNFFYDYSTDGRVPVSDFSEIKSNYRHAVPSCPGTTGLSLRKMPISILECGMR